MATPTHAGAMLKPQSPPNGAHDGTSTSTSTPGPKQAPKPANRGIVVFGGGTATNSLVDIFDDLRQSRNCTLSYVIPISDNGGSSSELIRVFGGPGIGDVRSRLVRLIPTSDTNADLAATKALFNHRLSPDPAGARAEWLDIVEGRHALWRPMASDKRELVRSFFNLVNLEIVKRARPSSTFHFGKAAVGNLFLTGARLFSGSLESAVYLLSQICDVPPATVVLPAINSNFTHHISAGLADGSVITGQNAISHPSAPSALPDPNPTAQSGGERQQQQQLDQAGGLGGDGSSSSLGVSLHSTRSNSSSGIDTTTHDAETDAHDLIEDATLPGSLPTLRRQYIDFSKSAGDDDDLPARIERVWYINPYGHEIAPRANARVVAAVEAASAVVYSVGSLYTSIVPSLIVRGVGAAIAGVGGGGGGGVSNNGGGSPSGPRHKILILNSRNDRETGPRAAPYSATDFARAIVKAGAASLGNTNNPTNNVNGNGNANGLLPEPAAVRRFVTHLIYLEGDGAPKVDRDELGRMGVDCVRVYGRRAAGGDGGGGGELQYDDEALRGTLAAIVGREVGVPSRRNTKQ